MYYKFLKKQKRARGVLAAQHNLLREKINKRKLLLNGLFLLILVLVIYFLVWGNFWKIEHIEISGTQRADLIAGLVNMIRDYQEGFYYRFIPRQNILFLDTHKLSAWVNQRLYLDELKIEKKFPNRLLIEVKEKEPVLIWQSGQDYYYIDRQGIVMSAKKITQLEYDLPLISSLNHEQAQIVVGRQLLRREQVSYIKETVSLTKKMFDNWYVEKVILPSLDGKEIFFYSNQGWYFILSLKSDKNIALTNLALFLKQKQNRLPGFKYIDLRIGDRLFYK